MEKIFTGIKPWSLHHKDELLSQMDNIGKRLATILIESAPREPIVIQHSKYRNELWFDLLIDDLAGKPYLIVLYSGHQEKFNKMKLILREEFGEDIPPLPPLQRNALHISDSQQEFERDYNAWRNYLNGN